MRGWGETSNLAAGLGLGKRGQWASPMKYLVHGAVT